MAGIYLHIPFCKTRCTYCDFYSNTDELLMDTFVEKLCAEARIRKDEISESIKTIYFGGGTPSQLKQMHFEQIFDTLFSEFSVDENVEITLETNPDDLSPEYIKMLVTFPFNRLSIGIQSFDERELKFLSRRHSAQQAIKAVKNAQQAGFNNISIDLMYGLPGQTLDIWQKNLQQTIDLNVQHVSAYHLIYEEDTKMYSLLQAGKINPVDEQTSTEMFSMLINQLTANNGFIHYEISNFGKLNYFSRHNSSYWLGEKYIGLGAAAHSFDGDNRSWNVSSLTQYINTFERVTEKLVITEKYNEFIFTGLRTIWGVDLPKLKNTFGEKFHTFCLKNAQKYIDNHLVEIKGDILKLSHEGIFISDGIMSDLMWVE
ncbi:MAG: radical SAM family heme chaperone HemW [Dysgonamonadaceae bacterium]|jgi:oxygen-independent coproporphyrinogen-3 oxidase|nr:radical SAM family heme chaperone HemW [Dysgonamonadaceae bacterium]